MKTKRNKKYKLKAGSYARKLDELIPLIGSREFDLEQIELQRLLPDLNQDVQGEILIELLADQEFRNDTQQINLARLNQLNRVNQTRGQNFRLREQQDEEEFNRRIRQRRGTNKKRKKLKRRKTRRGNK